MDIQSANKEVWKDVKDFEGVYQISNMGRIKSFKENIEGRVLSNVNQKGDYFSIILQSYSRLSGERKIQHTRIHRLVAETFIPNPLNKPQINHKDMNKQNNCVDNLEWVTCSENVCHAIKNGANTVNGMVHYNRFVRPKTIQQFTQGGKLLAEYPNSTEAQKATGVCQRNILQVAGKEEYGPGMVRKQAGGYVWKFKPKGSKQWKLKYCQAVRVATVISFLI